MVRLFVAALLGLGASIVPIATATACSCAMPGTPAEIVASSAVTFIGTVVERAPAGGAPPMGRISYAFEIERASVQTGAVVEVESLDDPGGAACGFSFGIGERWLVAAHRSDAGLETNLCSGNQLVDGMPPADLDRFDPLLTHAPQRIAPEPAPEAGPVAPFLPVAIGVGAVLLLGAAMWLAFRREVR